MNLSPYLIFNGNCEEALKFYEQALGAKIGMLMRYGESPVACETAPETKEKIMHANITIGDNVIMASDAPIDRFEKQAGFFINLGVDTAEEGERLFNALSPQAEIRMPFGETFWALRFGMLVDRFGIPWMVNCEKKA